MSFQKGHKGFKPKGAQHEKTKQWETLAESIVTTHTERFNGILSECDDKVFLEQYLKILEYFKPKLNRSEITGENNGAITIKVVRE